MPMERGMDTETDFKTHSSLQAHIGNFTKLMFYLLLSFYNIFLSILTNVLVLIHSSPCSNVSFLINWILLGSPKNLRSVTTKGFLKST